MIRNICILALPKHIIGILTGSTTDLLLFFAKKIQPIFYKKATSPALNIFPKTKSSLSCNKISYHYAKYKKTYRRRQKP